MIRRQWRKFGWPHSTLKVLSSYTYERSVEWITVGCHSVLPRSQRALPLFKHYQRNSLIATWSELSVREHPITSISLCYFLHLVVLKISSIVLCDLAPSLTSHFCNYITGCCACFHRSNKETCYESFYELFFPDSTNLRDPAGRPSRRIFRVPRLTFDVQLSRN